MDNFMDKLAQKLNAQEMIKANSAADAAQMNKLQSQMAEYDAALQEIRKAGLKNVEIADKLNQLIADATQQIEQLTKESIAKVEAAEVSGGSNEAVERQLTESQTKMEQQLSETCENLEHKLAEACDSLDSKLSGNNSTLESKLEENQAQTAAKLAELAQSIQESKEEQLAALTKTTYGSGEEQLAEILQTLQENQQEMQELIEKTQEYVHTEDVKVYRNVQAVIVEENSKQIEKITNAQSATGVKLTASVVFSAVALVAILVDLGINLAKLLGLI